MKYSKQKKPERAVVYGEYGKYDDELGKVIKLLKKNKYRVISIPVSGLPWPEIHIRPFPPHDGLKGLEKFLEEK